MIVSLAKQKRRFSRPEQLQDPGSVLKKIDRGARLIFLGLKFLIFLFFWVWKISLIFLGLKIFHLFFWGNNFDTIYFLGCLIK